MGASEGGRGVVALVLVLAAHLLLLTLQVRNDAQSALLKNPFAAAVAATQSGVNFLARETWPIVVAAIGGASSLRVERDALEERVARLQWEVTVGRGLLERARGFTTFDAAEFALGEPVEGEVTGVDASPLHQTLTVNRGSWHGVAVGSPVMSANGLAGRVIAAGFNSCQVELLTDPAAAVAVVLAEGRARGLVRASRERGERGDPLLRVDFIAVGESVAAGEGVITSGLDGIHPKGLPVGTVLRADSGSGMTQEVLVTPATDFDSLERVFILPKLAADSGSSGQ